VTVQNWPKGKETAGCDGVTVENGVAGNMEITEAQYVREERLAIRQEPPPEKLLEIPEAFRRTKAKPIRQLG
jgi:hypothetical protein